MKKTRAWAALCALLEGKTQLDIQAETGVPQSVISSLVTLARRPGGKTMLRLEKAGIRSVWWAERAGKKAA